MLNTIEIYHELRETMDDAAAEKIAAHLGQMYGELRAMVKREDFSELKGVVKELAEAQKDLSVFASAARMRITLIDSSGVVIYDSSVPVSLLHSLDNHS